MHKSKWKVPFFYPNYLDNDNLDNLINVSRSLTIPNFFYKKKLSVYNGQSFFFISIKKSMLGRKFGEFAKTKILGFHKKKKSKKRKK